MTLDELVELLEGIPGIPPVLTVGETVGVLPVVQVSPQRLELTAPDAIVKDVYWVNVTYPMTPFREQFAACHATTMDVMAGLRNDPGSHDVALAAATDFTTDPDAAQPQMRYAVDIRVRGATICAPPT